MTWIVASEQECQQIKSSIVSSGLEKPPQRDHFFFTDPQLHWDPFKDLREVDTELKTLNPEPTLDCDRNESTPWFCHYCDLEAYLFLFPISNKAVNMADIHGYEAGRLLQSNSIRNYDAMWLLLEHHWDTKVGADSRAAQDNVNTG